MRLSFRLNEMTKNLIYILAAFSLMACKNTGKPASQEDELSQETVKWLVFDGADENAAHIVFISGDEEYRSEEALPQLAKILSLRHGFKCTVLFAQDSLKPGIVNPNFTGNIYGLEALDTSDLIVVFTRFRALPDDQMEHIDRYLKSGKPVVGIRTATHAFNFDEGSSSAYTHYGFNYDGGKPNWKDGFGRLVLGETWINHHGHHKHQSTRGVIADEAKSHPITNGIEDGTVWGSTDVYGLRLPLPDGATPVVLGQVMERLGDFDETDVFYGMQPTDSVAATTNDEGLDLNNPMMPVAWIKPYKSPGGKEGRVFASTIGASADLLIEGTRRLLVNGIYWALEMPVPPSADVELVGEYQPTQYEFRDDKYWEDEQLKVKNLN
jgi:type 1 glutamine amidotransferase